MKMSKSEADKYLNDIIGHINHTLKSKGEEYIRNEDYMHNFNVGAEITGRMRERVIESFRLKHEISRQDILADVEKGKQTASKDVLIEKYGDIINYHILELMSMLHRNDNEEDDRRVLRDRTFGFKETYSQNVIIQNEKE